MSKQKSIFFLANTASIHTVKWVDFFVEKGYDVHLATFSAVNNTKADNIYFLSNKKMRPVGKNYYYLFAIPKLIRLLKQINPDIINAHYSYSMGLLALLSKRFAKAPAILSVVCHGSDVLNTPRPRWLFALINQFVLSRCDRIFAVSDQIFDHVKKWSIPPSNILVGQYGVPLYDIPSKERDIDILSNRADVPNSCINELLSGLDHPALHGKNILFVLPHVTKTRLALLSQQYPKVTFSEAVDHETMTKLLERTKIYISATQSDGTSLSLLEAMERGCYPVLSNIVSNRSWIVKGINGDLFYSFSELPTLLEEVLSETPSVTELNRSLIQKYANYETQMVKFENFLRKGAM